MKPEKFPKWEVSNCNDLYKFLRTVVDIIPDGSTFCFDGICPDYDDIKVFLEERKATEPSEEMKEKYHWQDKYCRYILFDKKNAYDLAEIMEHHAKPELADHIHIYKENIILLQWHHIIDDPLYIDIVIDEIKIKKFCEKMSLEYKYVLED